MFTQLVQYFNVFIIFIIGFEGRNLHLKGLQGKRVFPLLFFTSWAGISN